MKDALAQAIKAVLTAWTEENRTRTAAQQGAIRNTWAEVAGKGPDATHKQREQPVKARFQAQCTRADRVLGVRTKEGLQNEQDEKKILERLRGLQMEGVEEVVSIHKVGGSRFNILMGSEAARLKMQQNEAWLHVFGEGAWCNKPKFTVICHGVRISRQEKGS